ncbi:conserved hypothetical protein, partial [Mycobacterium tuberculosis variant africanum GM041182]
EQSHLPSDRDRRDLARRRRRGNPGRSGPSCADHARAGLVRSTVNSRPPGRRSGRALPGDYESRLPPGGFL